MKLCKAFVLLFIATNSYAQAEVVPKTTLSLKQALRMQSTGEKAKPESSLSVPLYLPLASAGEGPWSSLFAQSQLTVTPIANYTVGAIRVTAIDSTDGSCTGNLSAPFEIGDGTDPVTLVMGQSYTTTDASNYALYNAYLAFYTSSDNFYELLDSSMAPIPSTQVCIAAGGVCNDPSDCGWSSPRFWTP